MRAINFVAGITLVVVAYPFYQGRKMDLASGTRVHHPLPTIFGVLTSLPHVVQYGRPPAAGWCSCLGWLSSGWFYCLKWQQSREVGSLPDFYSVGCNCRSYQCAGDAQREESDHPAQMHHTSRTS